MSKQYGLILPNKKTAGKPVHKPSIFDDDSDSDTPKVSRPETATKLKAQDLLNQKKALDEDPTVFQYDELYDDMENQRKESKLARKDIDKKPKYISKLLAAAERRKRENERRIEREVQREREAEGEEFKDKESFVTSSYKKKLEEMKLLDEQERREEYLEAIGDVTKQGNLDGFYRHLYDQKVNFEDDEKEKNNEVKKEIKEEPESEDDNKPGVSRRRSSNSDKSESENKGKKQKRKYRSRKNTGSDDEPTTEKVEIKKEHLPSNLDADSDFSVDSSSDSEDDNTEKPKSTTDEKKDKTIEHEGEKLQLPSKGNVLSDNAALSKQTDDKDDLNKDVKENGHEDEEPKPKKPKIDIWKKRTVGEVYDEAVKRYFERKSARGW